MEIYSGKTLSPANLSNEYNRMLFLFFGKRKILGNRPRPLEACFPFFENAQNSYRSVEKTGKIKKYILLGFTRELAKLYFGLDTQSEIQILK